MIFKSPRFPSLFRRQSGHDEGLEVPVLEIKIDERLGSAWVHDARLFQRKQRTFCKRLVKAASAQPGIRKAVVDLDSASLRIEFSLASNTTESMADALISAVRTASEGSRNRWGRSLWQSITERWSTVTAFRLPEGSSLWETLENHPGRVRLRHKGGKTGDPRLTRLSIELAALEGIEACRVFPRSDQIAIAFHPDSPVAGRLVNRAEYALETLHANLRAAADTGTSLSLQGGGGVRRWVNLALAGGSLAMTIVAVAVPGMPTVPFLLATSYYLARSSPRLDAKLRRTIFLGPILEEWEEHRALSRESKQKLMAFTGTIVAVTLLVTPLSEITLILVLLMAASSLIGIGRMPEIAEESRVGSGRSLAGKPSLVLPAP